MEFTREKADIFIPDNADPSTALKRTVRMGIGAHQDDLEIMAYHGILECFRSGTRGFLGVVVSDGAGSPRQGDYAKVTDEQMQEIRKGEQRKAATIGNYSASVVLCHPTAELKNPSDDRPVRDLFSLLKQAKPKVVYTHNLADKHDTHVAVALRAIKAIRMMPPGERPAETYGCEVWRDLDWLDDSDKKSLDVGGRDNLASALLGVHDSQVAGGKRYDLATLGRRRANATYNSAHATDNAEMLIYAMDLSPLIRDESLDIAGFISAHLDKFSKDVAGRLARLS